MADPLGAPEAHLGARDPLEGGDPSRGCKAAAVTKLDVKARALIVRYATNTRADDMGDDDDDGDDSDMHESDGMEDDEFDADDFF